MCSICNSALSGRRTKYCSTKCAETGFTRARQADGRLREYRRRPSTKQRQLERYHAKSYTQTFNCVTCGQEHTNRRGEQDRHCSAKCARPVTVAAPPPPVIKRPPVDQRSALRLAWETEDWGTVQRELLAKTERQLNGCRLWTGRIDNSGYASVRIAHRSYGAHRAMATAVNGGTLDHRPVHHKCANGRCIAPDHLQIVQPHENTAEMLERSWYLKRIAALEDALASVAPQHVLLATLPFAEAA